MVRGHLDVVGTDAAGLPSLSEAWRQKLLGVDWVAAPSRFHADLETWCAGGASPPRLLSTDRLDQVIPCLKEAIAAGRQGVLLASGDPLWFGIGRLLLAALPPECLAFHPAPTSLQLAFSRLGRPWQDARWVSVHGRDPEPLVEALRKRPAALVVLTDPGPGHAETVRRVLLASGLSGCYALWVCERLGHPRERVRQVPVTQPLPDDIDPLHLVVLLAESPPEPDPDSLPLFGLEDGLWLQHADHPGLMTKREVRVQLLADLCLPDNGVLWDVGAGVGSVGLEALRLRPRLRLWALERRLGSAALIHANARRLGVRPEAVVEGVAPEALADWPAPDRVLIGGAGRARRQVLRAVLRVLKPGGRVVLPLATLEALAEIREDLEEARLRLAVGQIQIWRGVPLGDGTRLAPLNPVFVVQAWREGEAGGCPPDCPA